MPHVFGEATTHSPRERTEAAHEVPAPYEATEVVRHLAHELRQPLSTIESIAYYLEMVLPPQEVKIRQQVEKLQQVTQQASWILSDAVHFLQASPPMPQLIDLDEIVTQSVAETSRGDQDWVHLELGNVQALVRFDLGQARHLLRNVLFFMRQIGNRDEVVRVCTFVSGGSVKLAFEANASEHSMIEVDSMFDPFSAHLPSGSGLALASVRRIAEVQGGDVELRRAEGGRLRLELTFPSAL